MINRNIIKVCWLICACLYVSKLVQNDFWMNVLKSMYLRQIKKALDTTPGLHTHFHLERFYTRILYHLQAIYDSFFAGGNSPLIL